MRARLGTKRKGYGGTLVEYLPLLGLILLVAAAALTRYGSTVGFQQGKISQELAGLDTTGQNGPGGGGGPGGSSGSAPGGGVGGGSGAGGQPPSGNPGGNPPGSGPGVPGGPIGGGPGSGSGGFPGGGQLPPIGGNPGTGNPNVCPVPGGPAASPVAVAGLGVGNPIHVVSGNKYQAETDLATLPGELGLEFVRHYNSQYNGQNVLGFGWSHSYWVAFTRLGDKLLGIQQADGRSLRFSRDASGAYRSAAQQDGVIQAHDSGYTWTWPSGRQLHFNPNGQLTRIETAQGDAAQLTYNDAGQLTRIDDPQGRSLRLNYYTNGRLARLTDPGGASTVYSYDAQGNLSEVWRDAERVRRYRYEDPRDPHNLTGLIDERGAAYAHWAYDDQDRAILSEHAGGVERVTLRYGVNQTRVTDSQGRTSTYWTELRAGHPLVTRIDGPGCSQCSAGDVEYRYNEQLQLTRVQPRHGATQHYEYDAQGRLIAQRSVQGSASRDVLYRYSGATQQPTEILYPSLNPQGQHRLSLEYNAAAQLVALSESGWSPRPDGDYDPIERQLRLHYSDGRLVTLDGPREDVDDRLQLKYDSQGRLSELTPPDGIVQKVLAYDPYGRPTRIQRGEQSTLELSYDAQGRLQRVRQGVYDVRYAYTADGRLSAITDPDGQTTRLDYDAAGRAVALHSGQRQLQVDLDSEGLPQARRLLDARGSVLATVSYLYDAQGRLSRTDGPMGAQQYSYDDAGRLTGLETGPGQRTRFAYNDLGQLLSLTQPGDAVTRFEYDTRARLNGVTDARHNRTDYAQDDFGRVVQERGADSGAVRYSYDAASNRISRRDAQDRLTQYRYDGANRLIERRNADGTTRLRYGATSGRLVSVDSPASHDRFQYDRDGRLTGHIRELAGQRLTTAYAYDAQSGRVSQKTLPDGQVLDYHYYQTGSARGQLRAITRPGPNGPELLVGELDRDASDGETRLTYGNGLQTVVSYNALGQAEAIRTQKVLDLVYHYDSQGQLTGLDLNGRAQRFAYDPVGRLLEADTVVGAYRYQYDAVGNRTEQTHQPAQAAAEQTVYHYAKAGQGNRLLRVHKTGDAATAYRYNASGSPEQVGELRYEYNSAQRPIKVYQDKRLLAEYAYNGFGERIKKVVHSPTGKQVTYYLYDDRRLTAEADGQGRITAQYLYVDGQPVIKLEGQLAYAIHSDHLGTPRAMTAGDGQLVWAADYSPFGAARIHSATISLNLRFPGQYADTETGTYYNYFRDYDPDTGRYQTSDPIGLQAGINTYTYVANNPLAFVDPLGLDIEILIGGPYASAAYGHVALRVFGPGYDYTYDYGRYGQTWGVGGSEGEGQLRIWTDFNRYIAGENATGRTTSGYVYSTTAAQDQAAIDYFNGLIAGLQPNLSRGNYMNQYRIDNYHAANNNCTTVSLDGLEQALPADLYRAIDNSSFNQGRGLSWTQRMAFWAARNGQGISLPLDLQQAIISQGGYTTTREYRTAQ